jgi:hypothetical protein
MRWIWAAAAAILLGSCSSGQHIAPGAVAAGCDARRQAVEDAAAHGPDFVAISRAELTDRYRRGDERLLVYAAATSGPLHSDLMLEHDLLVALHARIARAWDVNNGEAVESKANAAGYWRLSDYIIGRGLTVHGRTFTSGDLNALGTRNKLRVGAMCHAVRPLRLQPTLAVAGGELYATDLSSHALVRLDDTGSWGTVATPRGWEVGRTLGAGDQIAFVGVEPSDGRGHLFVATTAPRPRWADLSDELSSISCAGVGPVASWLTTGVPPSPTLRQISRQGGIQEIVTDVDPERLGCATATSATDLMVEVGEPDRDWASIVRVDLATGRSSPLLSLDGCNLVNPRLSSTGTLAVLAGCADVGASGIYVAQADGSNLRQIVTGLAAAPAWSPDGQQLAFGYVSIGGDPQRPDLYVLDIKSGNSRLLVESASWPTWLPA